MRLTDCGMKICNRYSKIKIKALVFQSRTNLDVKILFVEVTLSSLRSRNQENSGKVFVYELEFHT